MSQQDQFATEAAVQFMPHQPHPPKLAQLLVSALPGPYARLVLCDLEEEFAAHILASHGPRRARRWYWRQALRSVPALCLMEVRSGNWQLALLASLLAAIVPTALLDVLWSLLLSQIPLKAGLARGADFAALSLGLMAVLGLAAGAASPRSLLGIAIPASWILLLLGSAAARGTPPWWFPWAALVTLTAAMVIGARIALRIQRIPQTPSPGGGS